MRARDLRSPEPTGEISRPREGTRMAATAATEGAPRITDPTATRVREPDPTITRVRQRQPTIRRARATSPGAPGSRSSGPRSSGPGILRAGVGATDAGPLILGRYRLKRRLGAGAFGTVWQARDEHLHREVAVKLLPRERISGGRFEREARAAARLAHPGIVTLYEAAVDDEGAYLVSELVRGPTLDQLLADGELSDRGIARIGVALCDALSHAHAESVVHRDVKPSNVLIPRRPTTPAGLAKLTDFGVARVIGGNPLTRTGDVLGTAAYMAPEQAEGRPAEAAADLYSLALVLYEALTGINPLANAPRTRRLGTYLPPLRRQRRDLPRALGQAVDTALRPRARERGTIAELRSALERCLSELGDRAGTVAGPRIWRRESEGQAPAEEAPLAESAESAEALQAAGEPTPVPSPAWATRALAGATAAGFAVWLTTQVFAHQPLTPAFTALAAALLVTMLPRLGWLTVVAASATGLAIQHRPGAAVIVLIVMLAPVIVLPRAPARWPLPILAPALGLVGLAGAWPALAARARTAPGRAALAAAGWLAVVLVGALAHKALYTRSTFPRPSRWVDSTAAAGAHVISPLLTANTFAAALVWAVAAAVFPPVRARRRSIAGLAALIAWAIATTVATTIAAPAILPGMAVLGAVACVVFTLAPDVTNRLRRPTRDEDFRSMEPR